ncbi:hypothetical protein SDC9_94908 [bioreactor metagenome]|uniref:Uncharacterized protein n=1 Tax=bioreactor metagenome TaxID=1076179 RepID=A0A645AET6_9ZZZZ
MIVYRDGQGHFCVVLTDDILIEYFLDFSRSGECLRHIWTGLIIRRFGVFQNAHAQMDAFIADIGSRTRNNTGDLLLMLSAERTANGLSFIVFGHILPLTQRSRSIRLLLLMVIIAYKLLCR